jgi:hypothetical protein
VRPQRTCALAHLRWLRQRLLCHSPARQGKSAQNAQPTRCFESLCRFQRNPCFLEAEDFETIVACC